jgi:hypothetical protein
MVNLNLDNIYVNEDHSIFIGNWDKAQNGDQ